MRVATHKDTGMQYAVKAINLTDIQPQTLIRLRREIQVPLVPLVPLVPPVPLVPSVPPSPLRPSTPPSPRFLQFEAPLRRALRSLGALSALAPIGCERYAYRVQGWGMEKYIYAYTHASSGPQGQ